MYCHNCGKEIVGVGIYCQSCGAKQNEAPEKAYDAAAQNQAALHPAEPTEWFTLKKIANSKVLKIVALIIAATIVLVGVIFLVINVLPEPHKELSAAELLDLGEKYLLDLNYEQALVQFMGVIEIEPRNARAYIGAAESYIGMGDTSSAITVLQQGLSELPDNAKITAMLGELTRPIEPEEPATSAPMEPEEPVISAPMEPEESHGSEDIPSETIGSVVVYPADINSPFLTLYAEEIDRFINNLQDGKYYHNQSDYSSFDDLGIAFCDLDSNGIPELIKVYNAYNPGFRYNLLEIGTIVDGDYISLENYLVRYRGFIYSDGTVESYGSGGALTGVSYFMYIAPDCKSLITFETHRHDFHGEFEIKNVIYEVTDASGNTTSYTNDEYERFMASRPQPTLINDKLGIIFLQDIVSARN